MKNKTKNKQPAPAVLHNAHVQTALEHACKQGRAEYTKQAAQSRIAAAFSN